MIAAALCLLVSSGPALATQGAVSEAHVARRGVAADPVSAESLETPAPLPEATGRVTVDVGVVYTPAVQTGLGGRAQVLAAVTEGILYMNHALSRSDVDVELRLVFVERVAYTASNSSITDIDRLRFGSSLSGARRLRDQHGADILTLFTDRGYGGRGEMFGPYSVVGYSGDATPVIFAHEWGHNFGADHDRETGCSGHSCGYISPDDAFRTIMAYEDPCIGCPPIPHFSNPNARFSPLDPPIVPGNRYAQHSWWIYSQTTRDASPSSVRTGVRDRADNARTIRQNATTVARWRATRVPHSPTCMGLIATWVGTDGDDVFVGTGGRDVVVAGAGDDVIYGRGGSDVICGGSGDDRIYGGSGGDFLFGGEGNDTIFGGSGRDYIDGGRGNDRLVGGSGADTLSGGRGHDGLFGGMGNDYLDGGPGNDVLDGGPGADRMLGRAGDDIITLGGGSDYAQPGPGSDAVVGIGSRRAHTLSFEDSDGPVGLNVSSATWWSDPVWVTGSNGGGSVTLQQVAVFILVGSRFDDSLTVGGGAVVFGLYGNDRLVGGPGSELYGDAGTDSCSGPIVFTCEA